MFRRLIVFIFFLFAIEAAKVFRCTPGPILTTRNDRNHIHAVASNAIDVKAIFLSNRLDISQVGQEVISMVKRLPSVPLALAKTGGLSFIQTGAVMIPLSMVLKINTLFKSGFKVWIKTGSKMGIDWAVFSGVFAGGVSFFATVRDKDDRWNTYLGSGLASAMTRIKDGPMGVCQGFAQGFAFLYAIDQFLPPEGIPTALPLSTQAMNRNAKMSQSIGARSAAAAVKRYGGKRG